MENELNSIREWNPNDFDGLIKYVESIFNYDYGHISVNQNYSIVSICPNGFDLNEKIVSAIYENEQWVDNFKSLSTGNGKHVFKRVAGIPISRIIEIKNKKFAIPEMVYQYIENLKNCENCNASSGDFSCLHRSPGMKCCEKWNG